MKVFACLLLSAVAVVSAQRPEDIEQVHLLQKMGRDAIMDNDEANNKLYESETKQNEIKGGLGAGHEGQDQGALLAQLHQTLADVHILRKQEAHHICSIAQMVYDDASTVLQVLADTKLTQLQNLWEELQERAFQLKQTAVAMFPSTHIDAALSESVVSTAEEVEQAVQRYDDFQQFACAWLPRMQEAMVRASGIPGASSLAHVFQLWPSRECADMELSVSKDVLIIKQAVPPKRSNLATVPNQHLQLLQTALGFVKEGLEDLQLTLLSAGRVNERRLKQISKLSRVLPTKMAERIEDDIANYAKFEINSFAKEDMQRCV